MKYITRVKILRAHMSVVGIRNTIIILYSAKSPKSSLKLTHKTNKAMREKKIMERIISNAKKYCCWKESFKAKMLKSLIRVFQQYCPSLGNNIFPTMVKIIFQY